MICKKLEYNTDVCSEELEDLGWTVLYVRSQVKWNDMQYDQETYVGNQFVSGDYFLTHCAQNNIYNPA